MHLVIESSTIKRRVSACCYNCSQATRRAWRHELLIIVRSRQDLSTMNGNFTYSTTITMIRYHDIATLYPRPIDLVYCKKCTRPFRLKRRSVSSSPKCLLLKHVSHRVCLPAWPELPLTCRYDRKTTRPRSQRRLLGLVVISHTDKR